MNPVALAQSFLMDIAAGTVDEKEMRERARQLAHDLEPHRSGGPRPARAAPGDDMTAEQRDDVEQSVAYHREHGGYDQHNIGGRFCRCAACRLVRTYDLLLETEAQLLLGEL